MAIASVGSLGSATSKTSTTTVTMTASADAEVGRLVVVITSWDNTDITSTETTRLSCTDESGNTWTKIAERTESDAGLAEDGATVAIFATVVTTQIDTGDDIIITSDTARVAKGVSAWEFTIAESELAVQDYEVGGGTSQPAAITLTGLPSEEYLLIYALGMQRSSSVTLTQDSDYSNLTVAGTTGGASTSNQVVYGGFRIATLTTDEVDVDTSTGGNHAHILAALIETGGGTITQSVGQITETDLSQTVIPFKIQYLRPLLDISDGSWLTDTGGSDLRTAIDETTASDADYITSSSSPVSPDICEIKVSSGANPNASNDGAQHHIRYRYKKDTAGGDSIDLTVRLVQASTTIASWTHTDISDTYANADQTLSDAEANAITDYGDLRLRFEATVG